MTGYPYWQTQIDGLYITLSRHGLYFPQLAHFYQTQQYSRCATTIRSLQENPFARESSTPTYYRAQYMLLLAICEPDDKPARVTNIQALHTLRNAVKSDRLPKRTRMFLERLTFISALVNVHLGGAEKAGGEPTRYIDKNTKVWLRAKTMRELGLEAFMVHYALHADAMRRLQAAAEDDEIMSEELKKLAQQWKLEGQAVKRQNEIEQKRNPGRKDMEGTKSESQPTKDKKRLSPYGYQPGLFSSSKRHRISVPEVQSEKGAALGTHSNGLEGNKSSFEKEVTMEDDDFSVKGISREAQDEHGSESPPRQRRQDFTEGLSLEELEEVETRRNALIANSPGFGEAMMMGNFRSPEKQRKEDSQELQGGGAVLMGDAWSDTLKINLEDD